MGLVFNRLLICKYNTQSELIVQQLYEILGPIHRQGKNKWLLSDRLKEMKF